MTGSILAPAGKATPQCAIRIVFAKPLFIVVAFRSRLRCRCSLVNGYTKVAQVHVVLQLPLQGPRFHLSICELSCLVAGFIVNFIGELLEIRIPHSEIQNLNPNVAYLRRGKTRKSAPDVIARRLG